MHNASAAASHQVCLQASALVCAFARVAAAELKTINGDCGEVMHESSPTLPTELKHSIPLHSSDPSLLVLLHHRTLGAKAAP